MPLACSSAASALSGADGLVTFKPAGVKACLLDNTDFSAGTDINVPAGNGFRLGDAVTFTEEGTGKLDSALTAAPTKYYIVNVGSGTIKVSATDGGTPVTLNGDGGLGGPSGGVVSGTLTPVTALPTTTGNYGAGPYTGIATTTTGAGTGLTVDVTVSSNNVTAIAVNAGGTGYKVGDTVTIDGGDLGGTSGTDDLTVTVGTASPITSGGDTPGAANHIELDLADYMAVCSVQEWSMSLSKDQTDVTTLPCSVGSGGSKVAPVRKQVGTFLNGEGSMSIIFTDDTTAMGQRLLADSIMVDSTVDAKLYVNAVAGAGATIDDSKSAYFEGKVTLLGFEISVNTSDALVATVNFSLADQPKALFGVTV